MNARAIKGAILVLGATGQQGGAVVEHLLAGGWKVRAFTRDRSSLAALALEQAGAQLAAGDLDDRVSLEAAMYGMYGVFSVQPPDWTPGAASNSNELRWGKNVVDAAKQAGVRHFVYSSVGGADKQSRFRDLAKWEIEQYIQAAELPSTVLRPAGFMENYLHERSGIQHGTFAEPTHPDVPIKLISVYDIGAFSLLAFDQPNQYAGKTIELAGDALTPIEIAAALSRATRRDIPYVRIPIETVRRQNEILAQLYDWLNGEGFEVDIPALGKLHPGLMDFDTWLEKRGRAKLEALFHREHNSRNE